MDPHHFNAESDLIESLLNHDSSIISFSLKIDSLLNEFTGELILLKSIPPGIDKTDCDPKEEIHLIKKLLYDNSSPRPPEEFISENSDAAIESFSPFPIPVEDSDSLVEEIDLTLTPDDSMPPGIEDDDCDSERNILILEELVSNDSLSLPENESFHFDTPSSLRPHAKPYYESNPCYDLNYYGFDQIEPLQYSVNPSLRIDKNDRDPEEEICLIEKLLYANSSPRPPKEFIYENSDAAIESFSPFPIPVEDSDSLMEEIDLTITPDDSMPPGIEDDDYDSERNILILEELLSNDSLSLLENESFYFDTPSSPRPPAKPSDMMKLSPIQEF
nr:hypothetical protein [Tanacetum cinerariifolium]